MQPIQDLLHRILWDADFGRGSFSVGYWDRVSRREEIVPFTSVVFDAGDPGVLHLTDSNGIFVRLPLHRVRVVYRDGIEIWRRPGRTSNAADRGSPV